MYFFKAELSLFDDDKETIFLIPNIDELPKGELPLFSESELTSHPKFASFVKRTKTSIVDIEYELYEAENFELEEITEEKFEELREQNKLALLDSNNYCIQTRKIQYKQQKKGGSLFPKIGIGAAALLLITGAAANKMRAKNQPSPGPIGEITGEVVYSSESSAEEPTDDESSLSVSDITESATSSSSKQSAVQSRGSSVTPTASSVKSASSVKQTSSAVSSSRSSTSAARSTAQISSSTAVSSKAPIEATTSR